MPENPQRPPLMQPSAHPPAPGDPAPRFAPTEPAPTSKSPRRPRVTRRTLTYGAIGAAFVLLVGALGIQTWRLNDRTVSATDPTSSTSRRAPAGSTTPPSSTPGTTTPPLPPGAQQLGQIPGIQCLADLIGKPPSATISRRTLPAQISSISAWDAAERELEFKQVADPALLSTDELAARVKRDVDNAYSPIEAALDGQMLAALGAVPDGFDMRAATANLYGGQVLGLYDPTTKQMVVGTDDGRKPLNTLGEVTLAHELEHALVDQNLTLPSLEITQDAKGVQDIDRSLARRSLNEGDATLIMNRIVLSAHSRDQLLAILNDPTMRNGAAATVPNYLKAELMFPYESGLNFTCALKQAGTWKAVNGAYSQPPATSAQILFPERFASREAVKDPPDLAALPGPWAKDRTQTFGAANLMWLFQAPGDNPASALKDPKAAAAGWGGGKVVQWTNGNSHAVGLSLVEYRAGGGGAASTLSFGRPSQTPSTTTPAPAAGGARLCDSVRDWYTAAFPLSTEGTKAGDEVKVWDGSRYHAVLRCVNDNVRLGIGSDLATARALVQ